MTKILTIAVLILCVVVGYFYYINKHLERQIEEIAAAFPDTIIVRDSIEVQGSEVQGMGDPAIIIPGEKKIVKQKETQATKKSGGDLGIPMPKNTYQYPDTFIADFTKSVDVKIVYADSDTTVSQIPVSIKHKYILDNTYHFWTVEIPDFWLDVRQLTITRYVDRIVKVDKKHMIGVNFIMTRLSSSVAVNYAYKGYLFGLGYDLFSESMLLTTGLNKNF